MFLFTAKAKLNIPETEKESKDKTFSDSILLSRNLLSKLIIQKDQLLM